MGPLPDSPRFLPSQAASDFGNLESEWKCSFVFLGKWGAAVLPAWGTSCVLCLPLLCPGPPLPPTSHPALRWPWHPGLLDPED